MDRASTFRATRCRRTSANSSDKPSALNNIAQRQLMLSPPRLGSSRSTQISPCTELSGNTAIACAVCLRFAFSGTRNDATSSVNACRRCCWSPNVRVVAGSSQMSRRCSGDWNNPGLVFLLDRPKSNRCSAPHVHVSVGVNSGSGFGCARLTASSKLSPFSDSGIPWLGVRGQQEAAVKGAQERLELSCCAAASPLIVPCNRLELVSEHRHTQHTHAHTHAHTSVMLRYTDSQLGTPAYLKNTSDSCLRRFASYASNASTFSCGTRRNVSTHSTCSSIHPRNH